MCSSDLGMTTTPARSAAEEAVRRRVVPYIGAWRITQLLGEPAEVLVPVVWWLRGRRGAPMAPTAVLTANAAIATAAMHLVRRRPGARLRRSVALPVLAWTVLSPALAGRSRRLVLLPGRNPLWALLLLLVPRLISGTVQATALVAVLRRAAAAAEGSDQEG